MKVIKVSVEDQIAELATQKADLEERKMTLYRKVKDFDAADSVTVDKAIASIKQFDSEISKINTKLKKLTK